jgi:hypothetical protein
VAPVGVAGFAFLAGVTAFFAGAAGLTVLAVLTGAGFLTGRTTFLAGFVA